MDRETAVRLTNKLQYRPGWHFRVHDPFSAYDFIEFLDDGPFTIAMRVVIRDTDPMWAPDYTREHVGDHLIKLDLDKIRNETEFYEAVFKDIQEFELHESREWFKVELDNGTLVSPFHPHTSDGDMRHGGKHIPLALRSEDFVW